MTADSHKTAALDLADREAVRAAVGRYLDGGARPGERRAVERALLDDAVAEVFAEELLLRHLLRHAPPDVPPEAVVARWEAAVLGQVAEDADAARADGPGWFDSALDAVGWSLRGPSLAVSTAGARAARTGLSTVLYGAPTTPAPKTPLWRRALNRGIARLRKKVDR